MTSSFRARKNLYYSPLLYYIMQYDTVYKCFEETYCIHLQDIKTVEARSQKDCYSL